MDKETREKINQIHDFCVRMEAVKDDVTCLKHTVYGNGKMGLRTQVIILWGVFAIVGGIAIKAVAR